MVSWTILLWSSHDATGPTPPPITINGGNGWRWWWLAVLLLLVVVFAVFRSKGTACTCMCVLARYIEGQGRVAKLGTTELSQRKKRRE